MELTKSLTMIFIQTMFIVFDITSNYLFHLSTFKAKTFGVCSFDLREIYVTLYKPKLTVNYMKHSV